MHLPGVLLIGVFGEGSGEIDASPEDVLRDFRVARINDASQAGEACSSETIDCVLVSPGNEFSGFDALEQLRAQGISTPVVVWDPGITAADAVRLVREGAWQCLGFGNTSLQLREILDQAVEQRRDDEKTSRRSAASTQKWRAFLIGNSDPMETVAETISLVGPRRCTVLISGETGTGKEMAARALHMASPRAHMNMVAINCTALPENLLEAELFGHTKGAFTGATNQRVGRFEQAHKGTIFLDEIGDMPLELQAKILRVLQDREIQRLGSSETIKVDVRVIAATNVDLLERVKQGRFREDLYYRLNVVPLKMPPLRKRAADIPALVSHFLKKICQSEDIPVKRIAPAALERLTLNAWPGNVRQLENAIEMAVAVSGERDLIDNRDFGFAGGVVSTARKQSTEFQLGDGVDFDTAVTRFELSMLQRALEATDGNKTAAAERLGIKRTTLVMKLRSFENSGFLLQAS